MPVPPVDLSRAVDVRAIVEPAGIQVKGLTPEIIPCPRCRSEQLIIYADPIPPNNGRWFYCRSCRLHGDKLEVFCQLNHIQDVSEGLNRLAAVQGLNVPLRDMTDEAVRTYQAAYLNPRQQSEQAWAAVTDRRQSVDPALKTRRLQEHLWVDPNRGQGEKLSPFMGWATRRQLQTIFGRWDIVPKDGHHTNLVLNFQDLPGRTTAFGFVGDYGASHYRYLTDPVQQKKEGGLALLEALEPFEPLVYAVDDYKLALILQKQHFTASDKPLKLVVFNDLTDRAWESVNADKVVMWSRRLDARLFQQARRCDGWIADRPTYYVRPDNPDTVYQKVCEKPARELLEIMNRSALHWTERLALFLTDTSKGEYELKDLLAALNLSTPERTKVMEACPVSKRTRLQLVLGEAPILASASMRNGEVVVKPDGWWLLNAKKAEELVMDATVTLHAEEHDLELATKYWRGEVRYKDKVIPFREKVSVINDDTVAWLEKLVDPHGTLIIHPNFANSRNLMYCIGRLAGTPKQVSISSKLGIAPNGEIIYPRFRIKDGQFYKEPFFVSTSAPAQYVYVPHSRSLRPSDSLFPARVAWTCCAAAYVANLVAVSREQKPMPVLLVGGPGSIAVSAGRLFARGAGMHTHKLDKAIRSKLDTLRAGLGSHNYPAWIEPTTRGLLGTWPVGTQDHCFLPAETDEAAALNVGTGVINIYAPALRTDAQNLPPFDDVLFYLAHLQANGFELVDRVHLVDSVLEDFCNWYGQYLHKDQHDLFVAARRMLSVPIYPGDALIELAGCMVQCGYMRLDHAPFMSWLAARRFAPRRFTYIDDEAKKVFLPRGVLTAVLKYQHLPQPDLTQATEDLLRRRILVDADATVDGWLLELSYWEDRLGAWRRQRGL